MRRTKGTPRGRSKAQLFALAVSVSLFVAQGFASALASPGLAPGGSIQAGGGSDRGGGGGGGRSLTRSIDNEAATAAASSGEVSLDFVAAGPFTYDHETGVGGEYDGRNISKTNGVVESLEGGDFACGDRVVFFTEIDADADLAGTNDVGLSFAFNSEPTGQPGAGFVDVLSATKSGGDSGNDNLEGNESASIQSEGTGSLSGNAAITANVLVTNINASDVFILRLIVELGCQVGATPTGNLHAAITDAALDGDSIPVGAQTIPLKKVEDIAAPGIQVTKECTGAAKIGEDITYTITVTNSGNEPLTDLVVSDPLLGGVLDTFPNNLDVGESVTRHFTHTVSASDPDPLTNTVTASAEGKFSQSTVSDTDSCEADIEHVPGIDVEKTCPPSAGVGDTITYEITVTNTGDEPLVDLVVSDPLLGGKLGSFPSTLGVGKSVTRSFDHTITAQDPDPLVNTVTAEAVGADSQDTVSDVASCGADVENPAIDLVKDGIDLAHVGDTAPYTFTATNTGDVDLHDVKLVDPNCDGAPTLVDDGDGDAILALDEVWTYTCSHVISVDDPDPLPNTGTVSGVSPLGEKVSDQDDHVVDIIHPAIQIVKEADPTSGTPGEEVTYSYVITNIGDTTLYDVTLDDDVLGHLADLDDPLEPGESVELFATSELTADEPTVITVGSTAGTDILGLTVTDDDPASVSVVLVREPPEKNLKEPPQVRPTAFTGTDRVWLGWVAVVLAAVGTLSLLAAGRREEQN
jgi:uncharacterized repeat protein (TIGR01451 family)